MKVIKGTPGYLREQKKKEIIKTVIAFGLVAALLIIGYVTTGSRLNWFTLIAILGCLPAAKVLVGVISRFPYQSIDPVHAEEIERCTNHLTVAYDMIITSRDKIMPLSCAVVADESVIGYTNNDKVDPEYLSKHIRQILAQNQYGNVSVKIFKEYKKFVTRAEGLNNMAALDLDRADCKEHEEEIKALILCISM